MSRSRLIPCVLWPLSLWPAAAFAVTTASAPNAGPASAGSLLQVLLGLIVVLALMAAAAWLLRRFNASRGMAAAHIKILGGVSVGTRERIVLVEVADQWIVVGVAPGRVNALSTMPRQQAELPSGLTATPATAPAKNFSSWLSQTIARRNQQ
jgi:flagellar protein FliO/FliZ